MSISPEPKNAKPVFTLSGHTKNITSVAWSPNGRQLATGSADGTVRLWDSANGKLLHILEGHTNLIQEVAWSPDSNRLASSSYPRDRSIRVWDTLNGMLLYTLESHTSTVTSMAWSPNRQWLASGSEDQIIRLWDADDGALLHALECHCTGKSIAWAPNGRWFAFSSGSVQVWDPVSGTLLKNFVNYTYQSVIACSPNGKFLASGDGSMARGKHLVLVWDSTTGELRQSSEGHITAIQSLSWSPDGIWLASGSDDGMIRLWNQVDRSQNRVLTEHTGPVYSVSWSSDGSLFASSSSLDSTSDVYVWNTASWRCIAKLPGQQQMDSDVVWHPYLPELVTIDLEQSGKVAQIWKLNLISQPAMTLSQNDIQKNLTEKPTQLMQDINVFYCYAREDRELRDQLERHLSNLKRQYRLKNWYDRQILPGENWEKAIDAQLNNAHLILLLISPDFMASDYCYGKEMQQALERHTSGDAMVIPILLRPVHWEGAPFGKLQMLPTDAVALTRWPDRDEAFYDIVLGVQKAILELFSSKQ